MEERLYAARELEEDEAKVVGSGICSTDGMDLYSERRSFNSSISDSSEVISLEMSTNSA